MFTGIIEEIGTIVQVRPGSRSEVLSIRAEKVMEDCRIGDSIAVNGICLTVTGISGDTFTADVMHETLDRSSLKTLRAGSHVNLERARAANGRFGGHIVFGHVDGTGTIIRRERDDNAVWYTIQTSSELMHYIVEKGSIAIDGISLTVAKVSDRTFSVSIIPHTLSETILDEKGPGDTVNLENDIIGKYVEKMVRKEETSRNESHITPEFLAKYGF